MVADKTVALNRVHVRKFSEVLEKKAAEVLSRMDSGSALRNGAAGRPSDDADWAEQAHQEWVISSREHLDHVLLFQIKDALNRAEHGEFGECQSCGEAISMKRLKAVPWTRYCIECQDGAGDAA
jgi:DnaK suppressor protein